jgi:hypothetical protein
MVDTSTFSCHGTILRIQVGGVAHMVEHLPDPTPPPKKIYKDLYI